MLINNKKACFLDPKTHTYHSDGTGRDTYIKKINGGLYTQDMLHSLKPFIKNAYSPLFFAHRDVKRKNPPEPENKVKHYVSDGSGRDSYVIEHEGGRTTDWTHKQSADYIFHSSLRQYDKIPIPGYTTPNFITGLYTKSKKDIMQSQALNNQQRLHSRILSQAKLVIPPRQNDFSPKIGKYNREKFFPSLSKKYTDTNIAKIQDKEMSI